MFERMGAKEADFVTQKLPGVNNLVVKQAGQSDETIVIGEDLCITGGLYAARPRRFIYDRTMTALSSDRRLALRPFGYDPPTSQARRVLRGREC